MKSKLKLKKDDRVTVIAGKDKGKTGKILKVQAEKHRVVVEKVNMIKRHARPSQTNKGGIIEREGSISMSNVQLVCPKCADPTRIGSKVLEDGTRARICRKCAEVIDA